MYYDDNELNIIFHQNKQMVDDAYETTKKEHNATQANVALYEYFINYRTGYITRTNKAREKMTKFQYHSEEIEQILIEYAMSSYISNNINNNFSLDEISAYTNTQNNNLKYDSNTVVSIVALGAAWNTYWMTILLACNKKLKEVLVKRMIEERYIYQRKNILDNCNKNKHVRLKDGKKLTININKMNRDIDNMIHDDEKIYFINDTNNYNNYHKR